MNQDKKVKAIIFLVLWLSALLFVVFLFILSFNVRLCSDDLFLLANYKKDGWFNSVLYFHSSVRWSSFLLFNSIFLLNDNFQTIHWNLFIYFLVIFSMLFIGFSFLIRVIIERFTIISIEKKYCLLLSMLFVLILFFSTSEIAEVWFWTGATTVYLAPIVASIIGFGFLFSKKNNFWSYLIIFISFLFVSGAVETFAICIVFLLIILLSLSVKKKVIPELKNLKGKIGIALIASIVFLIINFTSQRIVNRYIFESSSNHFKGVEEIKILIKSLLEIKNIVAFVGLFVIAIVGSILHESGFQLKKINERRYLRYNVLLLIVIIFITFIPLAFTFHGLGPKRAWFPFNFFLILSLFSIAFYGGNRYFHLIKKRSIFYLISATSLFLLIGLYLVRQNKLVSSFSKQYDKRIDKMIHLQKSGNSSLVYFQPLSDAGMISNLELSDRHGKQNEGLKILLKLNYEIVLLEPKKSKTDLKKDGK